MDLEEKRRLRRNYRGRRLLACRAADDLHEIIEALGEDDGTHLPLPDVAMPPPPSLAQKRELQNMAATLLRMILILNDGQVSPQEVRRF
jgi:hypothetical protein